MFWLAFSANANFLHSPANLHQLLVGVFHKLLMIYWDFHCITAIFRGLWRMLVVRGKYPESDSCVEENVSLTSGVKGQNGPTGW